MKTFQSIIVIFAVLLLAGCNNTKTDESQTDLMKQKVENYKEVTLQTDLSWLSDNEKQVVAKLIEVSDIMDEIFWEQAFGGQDTLLNQLENDYTAEFVKIHYGPWDRLNNLEPFVEGYGPKPDGANFYPMDMTKEEFEAWDDTTKTSLYTMIRRDQDGSLMSVPYSDAFRRQHEEAAKLIREAARLAEDPGLKNYLEMRAEAFLTNEYQASDYAWMEMKTSNIDFVVGPIENYEDRLYGYKAAHEAFVLVKDPDWSKKLEKYNGMLIDLQKGLPVAPEYKAEMPGTDADMNVYDAIYYAGDCNAGGKTIAINLPNDPQIHLDVGTRKLQLKNSMKAKFDEILVPISDILIAEEQRKHIQFDAFFENTTFHEVAHGMGIKNTINGKGTARDALKEYYSTVEEAKADIMGLYLVTQLYEMGEITSGEVMDNYVTFFAGIFRSSRFGASSSHGKANMMNLQYFEENGVFIHQDDGTYKVDLDKMKAAVESQLEKILVIQGDGDYEAAKEWVENDGQMTDQLKADLEKVNNSGIPVDIVFKQGKDVLGL